MGAYEIFTKQGGLKLIKQYWQRGVLFTAGSELFILGKDRKALEILRLSAEFKTKKKLEKNYGEKLKQFERKYDPTIVRKQSNKVWVCWFQGIENAPEMVKICVNSLRKKLSDKEVIIITEQNLNDYVDFPDYIVNKWKRGEITHTHMTDLLRLELLLKYGGTWMDATVLCTCERKDIPDYFFDSELFLFQTLKPGRDGVSTFISSWYMSACTNNKILWLTRELLYDYWKTHNELLDYFLLHDFLCIVLEHNEDDWHRIVPRDNSTPHILLLRLFDSYDQKLFENIKEQTPFHKMSYKFSDDQMQKEGTFYKYIINHVLYL